MGAIGEIGRLQQTLDRLAQLPRKLAVDAAPGLNRMIRAQFDQGLDPYGRAWAPLRPATLEAGRTPPPLTAKGPLRRGTKVYPGASNRAGLRLVVGARYGFFAQVGFRHFRSGRRVPPRRILPQFGLPRAWTQELTRCARNLARQARGR